MNAGKSRRLARLIDESGRTVILPLDIVVPVGPDGGYGDTGPLVEMAGEVGVSGVILRWGEAKRFAAALDPAVGLIVRISGITGLAPSDLQQVTLNTVAASAALGADAVCIDVEMGNEFEPASVLGFARCCEEAEALGMPVLAEVHVPRPASGEHSAHADALAWGARTARELGADLIKVTYPGSAAAVATVCDLTELPVVVAGGARRDPFEVLETAAAALEGGAAGTAFGRNVIGHVAPASMQRAIVDLVRGRQPLEAVSASLRASENGAAGAGQASSHHARHA